MRAFFISTIRNPNLLRVTLIPMILFGQMVSASVSQDRSGTDFFAIPPQQSAVTTETSAAPTILGYSEHGREIVGYEFGEGENVLLLFGTIHGNEKGTKDLLDRLVFELDATPTLIHPENRVMIIPLVNPDGYFSREDKLNGRGVNLNRNFQTKEWVQFEGEQTFAGFEPFSEAEARLIRDLVFEHNPVAMVTFHSKGALVSPEDTRGSKALARWYAKRAGYKYFDEWEFAGTATRWFEETTGNPAITVELTTHKRSDWNRNSRALLELLREPLRFQK